VKDFLFSKDPGRPIPREKYPRMSKNYCNVSESGTEFSREKNQVDTWKKKR
jgi:hypothetical protein